jgi:UDPglucose--hexose-1-phosphate uridylyltransferase
MIEGILDRRAVGMFDMMSGVGAHEVVVETPKHEKALTDLGVEDVAKVMSSYRNRSLDLARDKRFKYILIFKNHGIAAGASLEHTHTQLIALPMVPKNVAEEMRGTKLYFDYRERCIFCDMIRQERGEKIRVLEENDTFVSFCPFASRFPFEIWVLPKEHYSDFTSITNEQIKDLSKIMKDTLLSLKLALSDPPYNFIIHTSPIGEGSLESYHWHIEIMPRLMRVAGFEAGSGFYINRTPPELAIKYLLKSKAESDVVKPKTKNKKRR